MNLKKLLCLMLPFMACMALVKAQSPQPLTGKMKQEIVDSLQHTLLTHYIYLDTAKKMGDYMESRLNKGAYNTIDDPMEFARILNSDLHSVYNDKHLGIMFDPRREKELRDTSKQGGDNRHQDFMRMAREANFGFVKVDLLIGNVGYMRIDRFFPVNDESAKTIENAIYFLRNTRALMIDLRWNGGGDADMVRHFCSYFFKAGTETNDMYERRTNTLEKSFTDSVNRPAVFLTMPVYVLTGATTFSGAEEFSYDIQQSGRGKIVGATTGGAAHPVGPVSIGNGFIGNIPYARPINPFSKTNWEAIGVKPDIETGFDSAQDYALLDFFNQELVKEKDPARIQALNWQRGVLNTKIHPVSVDTTILRSYEGIYAGRKVQFQKGALYYTGMNGRPVKLIPMSQKLFKREDVENLQIEFEKDGIVLHFDDGFTDHLKRRE